jgi:DNA-binding GntR family transcriptional regulator
MVLKASQSDIPAPRTAGRVAADVIRHQILTGVLPPGATLNQNRLAEEMDMSRIPVRDALQILAAEGLIVQRAHSTATVAPLSLSDLEELYELRLAIEPSLCRRALQNMRAVNIDRMQVALEEMDAADGDQWLAINRRFHAELYLRADRPRTVEILDRVRRATDRYILVHHRVDRITVRKEHELILDAVIAGHERRVEALVAAHLSDGYEAMIGYLRGMSQPG